MGECAHDKNPQIPLFLLYKFLCFSQFEFICILPEFIWKKTVQQEGQGSKAVNQPEAEGSTHPHLSVCCILLDPCYNSSFYN